MSTIRGRRSIRTIIRIAVAYIGSSSAGHFANLEQVKAMFASLSEAEKDAFSLMASKHPTVLDTDLFQKAFGDEALSKAREYAVDPWHTSGNVGS